MSECFVGEIRMFGGNYAPEQWLMCDGQKLNINDYGALYALIGVAYGGDGVTTFALPDLRGRVPLHKSTTYPLARQTGVETVTLTPLQMAAHSHTAKAQSAPGNVDTPIGGYWAGAAKNIFATDTSAGLQPMGGNVSMEGGSQPHNNMMPYLCISYIIATEGIYPQQS